MLRHILTFHAASCQIDVCLVGGNKASETARSGQKQKIALTSVIKPRPAASLRMSTTLVVVSNVRLLVYRHYTKA